MYSLEEEGIANCRTSVNALEDWWRGSLWTFRIKKKSFQYDVRNLVSLVWVHLSVQNCSASSRSILGTRQSDGQKTFLHRAPA